MPGKDKGLDKLLSSMEDSNKKSYANAANNNMAIATGVRKAPDAHDEAQAISVTIKPSAPKASTPSDAPKMHTGGPVPRDGVYQLKAGEHVLTAPEADKARKHAMMAVGMKSLAKSTPKIAPSESKKSEKKITSGVTVRPEKNQSAKIAKK